MNMYFVSVDIYTCTLCKCNMTAGIPNFKAKEA